MFLHVRLKVRDLETSIDFYERHFGATCEGRQRSPRGTQLAFLDFPGTTTQLELAFLPWDPDFVLNEDIFHLAFEVENMDACLSALRAAGVKVTEEPSERGRGGYMAFIEDPDGYEIELLSRH